MQEMRAWYGACGPARSKCRAMSARSGLLLTKPAALLASDGKANRLALRACAMRRTSWRNQFCSDGANRPSSGQGADRGTLLQPIDKFITVEGGRHKLHNFIAVPHPNRKLIALVSFKTPIGMVSTQFRKLLCGFGAQNCTRMLYFGEKQPDLTIPEHCPAFVFDAIQVQSAGRSSKHRSFELSQGFGAQSGRQRNYQTQGLTLSRDRPKPVMVIVKEPSKTL